MSDEQAKEIPSTEEQIERLIRNQNKLIEQSKQANSALRAQKETIEAQAKLLKEQAEQLKTLSERVKVQERLWERSSSSVALSIQAALRNPCYG